MIRRRFNISKNQSANTIINYSTTDGQLISLPLNSVSSFGVLLKSHYYGEIKFYGNVTKIGNNVFGGSNLTSITIPNSVTGIGAGAFANCTSLTTITIPESVTEIGNVAFRDCSSLTSVYCKATTPPALGGNNVFYNNSSGRKIYVPSQSLNAYKTAENWSEYAADIVGYDFENDTVVGG